MKFSRGRWLLLGLWAAVRLGAAAPDDSSAPRMLAPAEMKANLDDLMATFDEVHPNLYFKVSRQKLMEERRQLESELNRPLTVVQFFNLLEPFVASFADGHTGISAPRGVHPARKGGSGPSKPHYNWHFEILPGGTGYLDFVNMDSPLRSEWQKFLQATFRAIQEKRLTGLIIDLRNNGGGDSQLGDDLLDYLTDKPYRQASRKEWKFSPRYLTSPAFDQFLAEAQSAAAELKDQPEPTPDEKAFFVLNPNPSPAIKKRILEQGSPALKARLAKVAPHWLDPDYSPATARATLVWNFDKLRTPPNPYPLRFHGCLCFLISHRTFSSAIMLGNTVQDFKLAALIGEETPPCNEFGEVYSFELPHSGIRARVPSAQFVRANGDAKDPHGIIPDIAVAQTQADSDKGVDTVLETAKGWIAGCQRSRAPASADLR